MSHDKLEIVRLAYEQGYAKRTVDIPALRERLAENFRFYARRGFPGRPVYRADEMPGLWADLDSTFTDYSLSPVDSEVFGEYVLVTVHQRARLKGSHEWLEETVYHRWHIEDGKAQTAWTYALKAEALEAAGVSE